MKIYKHEAKIADRILNQNTLAYASSIQLWDAEERNQVQNHLIDCLRTSASKCNKTLAAINDIDLSFTKSIFVSTVWNGNDDVFLNDETWISRHTPTHKPTNLEHDEERLVGHITDTWAVDHAGNIIADNSLVDDLPSFFHLANGAVIYLGWESDQLNEQTQQLLDHIKAGRMFVSMEARFADFDYAVMTADGTQHIVPRDMESSFLTQHLRVYGGKGEFDGHRIGRALRRIVFSGKGYTLNPANKYSIIDIGESGFDFSAVSSQNPFYSKKGVLSYYKDSTNASENTTEKISMTDNIQEVTFLKDQNADLKKALASIQEELKGVKESQTEANLKVLNEKIAALQADLETSEKALSDRTQEVTKLQADVKASADQLTKVEAEKAELEKSLAETKAEAALNDRVSVLVDGGVDKSVATEKALLFKSLTDDQFAAVAQDIIAAVAAKKPMDDKEEDKKDKKGKVNNADAADLDHADEEVDEDLAADASEDEVDEVTKARIDELGKSFASRFKLVKNNQ